MTGPGLLVRAGLGLLLLTAAVGTPADADLWGHLTFGRDIVTTGHVIQADRYSFTGDRPWVNHEWLAETTFAEVYRLAGSSGLVALKLGAIAALLLLVWRHLKPLQISSLAGLGLIVLVFIGTFWRTHAIRPQLFSVLCFAALLIAIARADRGQRRALFFVPPLMALWVNLHGGWIVGIGVLGFWTACRIVSPATRLKERLILGTVGLTAVAATLLNPYGTGMWAFLAETVRLGRADIEEWASVLAHPMALGLPWLFTLTAAALAVWRAKRPRRVDYLAIVGLLALASFRVGRLDAFFALTVVILLAPDLAAGLASLARQSGPPPSAQSRRATRAPAVGVVAITVFAVVAMLVPAARIIGANATCLSIGGPWVPDADAGRFISLNRLQGRMLTWFDWGEYAIWRFGPQLQVSMDGRRETVYTDATIQAHWRFYAADEAALTYLRALNPDFMWLPARLPVIDRLGDSGWTPVFRDAVSIVYARAGAGPFRQLVEPSVATTRCFPGP